MLKFILISLLVLYVLYRLSGFLLKMFITKAGTKLQEQMRQQQQTQRAEQQARQYGDLKVYPPQARPPADEGSYAEYEEVK